MIGKRFVNLIWSLAVHGCALLCKAVLGAMPGGYGYCLGLGDMWLCLAGLLIR